jgi:hypothetical protein
LHAASPSAPKQLFSTGLGEKCNVIFSPTKSEAQVRNEVRVIADDCGNHETPGK